MSLSFRSMRRTWHSLAGGCLLLAATLAHANLPTVPAAPAPVPAAGVGTGGLLQAVFGMACVLGLILLCAWLARRFGLQRLGGGQMVKVISGTSLGQRERVVVVEVAGQWLVLGVTPQHISTLHTLPAQAAPSGGAPVLDGAPRAAPLTQATQAFSQLLRQSAGLKPRSLP